MRALQGFACALFLPACAVANAGSAPETDCAGQRNAVVISADQHRLSLCRGERAEHSYQVSLGRGGLGKRQAGDNRTPLGAFALGAPRPSNEFALFIPVGYPTAEQRQAGFSGGDIGIHGPKKSWSWLGRLANLHDWTRGCIALNRESDIREVAAWVNRNQTSRVVIIGAVKP